MLSRRSSMRKAGLFAGLFSLATGLSWANSEVPAEVQAAIVTRVLSYDRGFSARHAGAVRIGLLVKSGDASSANRDVVQAFSSLQGRTLKGLPVSVTARAYQGAADLESWITRERVSAIHVSPGLGEAFDAILAVCRGRGVISSSSVREFTKGGVLSVVLEADTTKVLINMALAQQAGLDLDPVVLATLEKVR
jgi:hypothetical protein